jgi:hypothetical protein
MDNLFPISFGAKKQPNLSPAVGGGPKKKVFFVASYAESWLSQGNLNQPDVAFCFMLAAIS